MFILDANRNTVFGWEGVYDLIVFVALEGVLIGGIWAAFAGRTLFMG